MGRSRSRHRRRSIRPSTSIAGYTRVVDLTVTGTGGGTTLLSTVDIDDVVQSGSLTENRKIIRVAGRAFFSAGLAKNQSAVAQFCLWAHPDQEAWPAVSAYDPFTEGPGETGFEGMLSPRPFCRRTFVMSTADSDAAPNQLVQESHMVRSKAERLLRPGWKLSAGLYVRATNGVKVRHTSLLRTVVAG